MSKTFLITGASAGLGSIFAESIANIARNIIIVGRDKNRLIKLSSKLKKINSKIHVLIITTDLSKENGVLTIFRKFESQKKIRFVDVVLNSAANFTVKKIEQISFEQLKKDFQLNVISPFLISKYFGLKMKKKKNGIIFNIGSSSSYDCSKNTSVYCSTKHALLGMTKAFNAEWQSQGVKSILIAPGSMKTSMGKKVKNQDFNTFIEPVEVAKTIKNLLNINKSMFIDEVKIKRKIYR
ncbi:SDR family NAD(P)-dependent oxidoreductase [Candidatus Pelagibacter sp.]|nr:SDR family NAD(P)-dependent oxidoreductase [Candidatus Pelagibacter sp.]|tara:strand:- start:37 stop:750 length:714 start_codon:yes stop_codon:yes gene_type:complete